MDHRVELAGPTRGPRACEHDARVLARPLHHLRHHRKGGVVGGVIGGTNTKEVVAFGEGMTRPERVSGADPVYTREALEAHAHGIMIVKCIIGVDGYLSNCRIIKPLPFMEKAVLESLYSRLYRPVLYQGKPVSVDYVFDVKLQLPRR
jgi:protein TonB